MFSCRSRSAKFQVASFLAEAELRNSIMVETEELQVTDCSVCESRIAELRGTVYSLCGSETAELQVIEYSLCGGRTAGLKIKALVWKWNCETSSRTKFIEWKRKCVTSKPQYISCAEGEMRNFRASSNTILCMRKRNCGTLSLSISLVRRRNCRNSSHIIVCVQNRTLSRIIFCMWNLSGILCKNPKCPGAQAEGPYVKAILAVLFSTVLIKHDRISWRVTRSRTLGKHHGRRPLGQYVEPNASS